MTTLSSTEAARYARQVILPGFGAAAQEKLKAARVLVVGGGGLGSPALLYLAAAGVGTLGVVDDDRVDESNLHRQVLYDMADVGLPKVYLACRRVRGLNPNVDVIAHDVRLTADNALDLIGQYDLVADGSDNFATRYLVNDACVMLGKPNVYASVFQYEGQVSVFNYRRPDGTFGPHYRDLMPEPPQDALNCAEGGVLGVLPGVIGSMQATEVIKVITGVGEPLVGRLFLYDALTCRPRVISFDNNPDTPPVTGLADDEAHCAAVPEITVSEFARLKAAGVAYKLIDVREPNEYAIVHMGGKLIPVAEAQARLAEIPREGVVVIHCKTGVRSAQVVQMLLSHGYTNVRSLKGGLMEWAAEIDPTLSTY